MALDRTNSTELALAGISTDGLSSLTIDNPTFHKNPKALDAKLTYSLFIPPLALGAMMYILLRSMARGYEYEMNKCYGCDLCDDACPVRLFTGGDKLNIIYNTWNNEDNGVPLFACLTCGACTNACPQLVDYDSYIDIRRNLVVGGPPAANIPHTVLQAVLAAEADEEANDDFISVADYPIPSNIGYYPGCVDYLDQDMVFSHLNKGEMNLGETTTAAFTLFDEMGIDVSYLGRDFLKCCGHDQKWQGMDNVFDKLKSHNKEKLEASGIDTLVSSCAECFHTFAKDYGLEGIKVMHTTEFLAEQGFDVDLTTSCPKTVTFHDPCRLGRQMNVYDEPRELIENVSGVTMVEMEHHHEDALCCGVSSMMSCNEESRTIRVERFEEVKATGADMMITSCPKCVAHFECLKFEGDPSYDFEITDIVSFLAKQIEEKKTLGSGATEIINNTSTDEATA
jgi:Fe-S oxidoreductase